MYARNALSTFAAGLLAVSGAVQAHVAGPVTVDFEALPSAVFGAANLALVAGACQGAGACYAEDGFLVGTVDDPTPFTSEHVHRAGPTGARRLSYHADSSGIYIRGADGHEFGLFSIDIDASFTDENPDVDGVWEILGFNTAVNPDLASGDGTNYASRIAYQTFANGFTGTLTLDHEFHEINAFWIHFQGAPAVPSTLDFAMTIDNVQLGPAEVHPVPVPALGLWALGAGFAGLVGATRRRLTA